jgi:hypothetical protein
MCIIVYHPKGSKLPSKETLERCWDKNDDGAGFMIHREGGLRVRKGFMSFEDFWCAFRSEKLKGEDEFAIHFRWATSGGVSKENCHPFPITEDENFMRRLKFKPKEGLNLALMHNGVLGKGEGNLSDTMVFVRDILAPVSYYLRAVEVLDLIENLMDTGKLMFYIDGVFHATGGWVEDKETGCWYSNSGFKEPKVIKSAWSDWERDENGRWKKRSCLPVATQGAGASVVVPEKKVPEQDDWLEKCPSCEGKKFYVSQLRPDNPTVACLVCGCRYDMTGNVIGYNAALWESYVKSIPDMDDVEEVWDGCDGCPHTDSSYCRLCAEDETIDIKKSEKREKVDALCKNCGSVDSDYLEYDDVVRRYFCLSCDHYV